ncbi:GNAT family N-acetyltransferase [Kitasatospora sp. NPDC058965]|uniref:GNAT family N-acetyltransferase n=1 Tax=Kitasatospora sp. NPDC058965 TaxID=3346682 RepID=UPI0036A71656
MDHTAPVLTLLHPEHAPALLAFELANRAYFAAVIPDRGDAFFEHFDDRFATLLAYQVARTDAFYLVLDPDGAVLGRFNLARITDGTAELGYRVAEHATGRGLATAAVLELCRLAPARHGLHTLRASVADRNLASRTVLSRTGFTATGPVDLNGKPGTWYRRDLLRHP